jgi:hypothetical protein
MRFKRVYHPVSAWEEIEHGMWSDVDNRATHLQRAVEFTSDHVRYGEYMLRVVREWPISCENALTDDRMNRRAWVGHAACALAIGCPEDITRQAWGELTDEQRLLANKEAERAIRIWGHAYAARKGLRDDVAIALLL